MKNRVRKFMKELGFKRSYEVIFGIYEGFLVSVADKDNTASIFVDISLDASAAIEREKIRSLIEENARQYSIFRAEVTNVGVLVLFNSSAPSFERLKDFFYFFIHQLKLLNLPGAYICTNCRKPVSAVSVLSINGRLHTCDRGCAQHIVKTAEKKGALKKRRAHFFPGLIGALFGAVLGIIPFVLISRLGIFSLWCGLLIGLFAKAGYEVVGGRRCPGKAAALLLLSVMASVPAIFLTYCYELHGFWSGKGYVIRFVDVIQKVFDLVKTVPVLRESMLLNAAASFGFAVLALLLVARLNKKSPNKRAFIVS